MNSIGSFGQPSTAAPWGGLPTGQQPWSGGAQWDAAQQAPWRMSPWQTSGMPSGQSVAAPPTQGAQLPTGYLSQGTSAGLNGFDPAQAGGGFYPNLLGGQQQAQQPTPGIQPNLWTNSGVGGGQVYDSRASAQQAATQNNNMVADGGPDARSGWLNPVQQGGLMSMVNGSNPGGMQGMSGAQVFQQIYGRR